MPLPNPNCPTCHGNGEVETWTYDDGERRIIHDRTSPGPRKVLVAISYDPCPCQYRPLVTHEEDWSDDRSPNLP